MRLAPVQHAEALAEGEIAHHVKAIEVEPHRHVQSLPLSGLRVDTLEEFVTPEGHTRFVVAERCRAHTHKGDEISFLGI